MTFFYSTDRDTKIFHGPFYFLSYELSNMVTFPINSRKDITGHRSTANFRAFYLLNGSTGVDLFQIEGLVTMLYLLPSVQHVVTYTHYLCILL